MMFRWFLLLLLLFSVDSQSYFSGGFSNNIANISTLIKTIVKKGDQETAHAKQFLSRIVITATEFPVEAEGSGEQPQKKTYIPLNLFQKYAVWYLASVEQQQATADQKTQLGESLRELRMDNVRRKLSVVDKYIESMEGTEAVVKYNQFEEKMIEVEKNVIKFFTLKKSPLFSSEVSDDILTLFQELNNLIAENEIFDLILAQYRYNDEVFLKLYNHFRKYAIFLTVARSVKEIQGSIDLVSNDELFEEHVKTVRLDYKSFLNAVGTANGRRETTSFTFENMFSSVELERLTESSILPLPENHNLFNFNWDQEVFEKKYAFLLVRRCGARSSCDTAHGSDKVVSMDHSDCTTTIYRPKLEDSPNYRTKPARNLRKIAMSVIEEKQYHTSVATDIVYKDYEHIAICTSMTESTVSDTAYSDDYINKVVVSLEARYEEETQDYGGNSEDEQTRSWKNGVIQVIGYYLVSKNDIY